MLTVPQFDTKSGGLNFVSGFMYISCTIIALFGVYGMLSGNIKGMGFNDGLMVIGIAAALALFTRLLFYFGIEDSMVVFYPDRIELTTKKGRIKKSIAKENIKYICTYEVIAGRTARYDYIPFEKFKNINTIINTCIIYISSKDFPGAQKSPNLYSRKSIFLHRNDDALDWINKYYSDKIAKS